MDEQAPLVAPTHHVWASAELVAAVRGDEPGEVFHLARKAACLTLEQLGRLYGCSASTLSRIERGQPPIDQVDVRRGLAKLLGIPAEYVGLARHAPSGDQRSASAADTLRSGGDDPMRRRTLLTGAGAAGLAALANASQATAGTPADDPHLERLLLAPTMPGVPLTLQQAAEHVTATGRAYRDARYRILGDALPALLAGLYALAAGSTGQAREMVAGLLSRTYQVASSLSTKHGDDAIALTMADRARTEAAKSGDPLAITSAAHVLAITLRRDGHHAAALDLLTGTAQQLDLRVPDAAVLAAYGNLLCTAAYTCAQAGNASAAASHIEEAMATAGRLGADPLPTGVVPFSSTTVAIYRIGIHTTLGDTGAALQHAASVNPALLPTPERHGRYLVDTARAWASHGRADKAAHAVLAAYRHAPEEVDRASVRDLVTTLLYSPTPTPSALRNLAARIGVA
jgi:transcriptional regulator with XRE-family HTH domain